MGNSATVGAGQEQHLRALEYANRVRLARARMKRKIAAGELSAAEVVLSCPWQAHSMSISDLLMSQKRWGRTRCRRLLVSLGVPENKQVGHAHGAPAPRAGRGADREERPGEDCESEHAGPARVPQPPARAPLAARERALTAA